MYSKSIKVNQSVPDCLISCLCLKLCSQITPGLFSLPYFINFSPAIQNDFKMLNTAVIPWDSTALQFMQVCAVLV